MDELLESAARFKNMLIENLSSMTLDELMEQGAKKKIRSRLMRNVNNALKNGKISNVYLDEFIIQ